MISISLFVGGVGFLLIARVIGPDVSFVDLWPGMVLMGITNGMVNPLLNTTGMEGVIPSEMGMASGLLNVFRQLGTTVGVVSLGLIQDSQYENYLNGHLGKISNMPAPAVTGLKKKLWLKLVHFQAMGSPFQVGLVRHHLHRTFSAL